MASNELVPLPTIAEHPPLYNARWSDIVSRLGQIVNDHKEKHVNAAQEAKDRQSNATREAERKDLMAALEIPRRARRLSQAFASGPNDHYEHFPTYAAIDQPSWSIPPSSRRFLTLTSCWVTRFCLGAGPRHTDEHLPLTDADLTPEALQDMQCLEKLTLILPDVSNLTDYYPGCHVDDGPPFDADVFCKVIRVVLARMPALPGLVSCRFRSTETVRRLRPAPLDRMETDENSPGLTRETEVVDIVRLPLGVRGPYLMDLELGAGERI